MTGCPKKEGPSFAEFCRTAEAWQKLVCQVRFLFSEKGEDSRRIAGIGSGHFIIFGGQSILRLSVSCSHGHSLSLALSFVEFGS
jgi:hypothetical protein